LHTFQRDSDISDAKLFFQQALSRIYSPPPGPITAPSTYSLYNDIRTVVKDVFKDKTISLTNVFYKSISDTFLRSLDTLLQETKNGIELVWYEAIQGHLDSGKTLTPSLLPSKDSGFFI